MNTPIQSGLTAEPTQGWAHKASFVGIIAGVAIVVGLGMTVYTMLLPVRTEAGTTTQPVVTRDIGGV